MWRDMRKRNVRNVDKRNHVTRVSANVPFTYERMKTMLSERIDTRELRVFSCPRNVSYVYAGHDILF